ncbi:hypothetical protein ElyMa_004994600 [Elysia marginata]|uniref:Transmembrane protein n=1 Tax=Elysia marginata TaxID=1093978 RepID=A0AAV4J7X5_9GAST|nr:hypothetical protein ElyMa_004994600 [Elysia marginata]
MRANSRVACGSMVYVYRTLKGVCFSLNCTIVTNYQQKWIGTALWAKNGSYLVVVVVVVVVVVSAAVVVVEVIVVVV